MKNILNIYKPVGKTPFEVVQKIKEMYPELSDSKIGYAGRLDPMAEGVLILLIDSVNKNKHQFEGMEKKYVFEAILGIETDTYDLLGIVTDKKSLVTPSLKDIKFALQSFVGSLSQPYPPYSSVRVNGKPLFYWAREKKINDITIPQKLVSIYSITNIKIASITAESLFQIIKTRVKQVQGNFRQKEIMNVWGKYFSQYIHEEFPLIRAEVHCSSGTYIRSLVNNLGKKLNIGAVTLSIKRTAVGEYIIQESEKIY